MARPPFVPTDEQRNLVRAFAAFGIPQEYICQHIRMPSGNPIGLKALTSRFAEELREGKAKLIADAGNWTVTHMRGRPALYDTKSGKKIADEIKPNFAAAQFILETQGKDWGWTKRNELTGGNGLPLGGGYDLTRLTENELRDFELLARKATGALTGPG